MKYGIGLVFGFVVILWSCMCLATLENCFLAKNLISGRKCLVLGESHDAASFSDFCSLFDLNLLKNSLACILELPEDTVCSEDVKASSALPYRLFALDGLRKICADFPESGYLGPQFGKTQASKVVNDKDAVVKFWDTVGDPSPLSGINMPTIGGFGALLFKLKKSFQLRSSGKFASESLLRSALKEYAPNVFMGVLSLSASGMRLRDERFASVTAQMIKNENALFPVGYSHLDGMREQLQSVGISCSVVEAISPKICTEFQSSVSKF